MHEQQNKSISLMIDSRLDLLLFLVSATKGICEAFIADEWVRYQLQLCVDEVASNIIIHAYQREAGHPIELVINVDGEHIIFKFLHQGQPGALKECSQVEPDPTTLETLPESGRGIYLLNMCMDSISLGQEAGKHAIYLTKRLFH